MGHWLCSECDYVFEAEMPPEECPGCHEKCTFSDVTCYIPECGGPGNIDSRLVVKMAAEAKNKGIQ